MKDYTFLNRPDYFKALTGLVRSAQKGERVLVATMDLQVDEPLIGELLQVLKAAAKRQARVTLLADAHNFLTTGHGTPGPLFYKPSLDTVRDTKLMQQLEGLKRAGGTYRITNLPRRRFSNPVAGRSHVKAAIVGEMLFVGGCNLGKPQYIDAMVQWRSKTASNQLANWLEIIAESGQTREAFGDVDSQVELDKDTRLIIDAGAPNQSLIYEEALQLIDTAKERLFITCQFFPGGQTASHLAAAQARGVNVEIIYSHPRVHGPTAPLHHLHQLAQHARHLPPNFFEGKLEKHMPKLHAKILASESCAMIGSHNFVEQGVQLGTAELALRSSDPGFVRKLHDFMHREISHATHVQ